MSTSTLSDPVTAPDVEEAGRRRRPPAQIIRWEEPPPARYHRAEKPLRASRYDQVVQELRERPGRGAVIFEGAKTQGSGLVAQINGGQIRCFAPAGTFHAESRTDGDQITVYARYVGAGEGR